MSPGIAQARCDVVFSRLTRGESAGASGDGPGALRASHEKQFVSVWQTATVSTSDVHHAFDVLKDGLLCSHRQAYRDHRRLVAPTLLFCSR
jgi:hypothetical protein